MSSFPLVTIGLPVYNGMPQLRTAVESLLAQKYTNLEIVISDNASDDGTSDYCRALAQVHARVKYARNDSNVGPLRNFELVLERAQGSLFMWAADDDKWNDDYVAELVARQAQAPDAVLITPSVIHLNADGTLRNEAPDRPAAGAARLDNLARLYDDHAASWIYGLWQTDWLRTHFVEYQSYPFWGADVLWLADICLRYPVAGNQDAVLFKRMRKSRYAPRTARQAVAFWFYMFWHTSQIAWRNTSGFRQRAKTLSMSWRYVYRLCIRRPHLLRTMWRVVRVLTWAAITSIPFAIVAGLRAMTARLQPTLSAARSLLQ